MKKSFLFFLSLSGIMLGNSFAKDIQADSKVLAEVNNEKIYKSGIDIIVDDLKKAGTPVDDKTRATLVSRLVEQKLIAQHARKNNYDKHDDVKRQIEIMTEMVLRDSYLSDLVAKKVNDQMVKQEYDKLISQYKTKFEYKASHILVSSKEKADEIYQKIKKGEKFEALAKSYSKDSNASKGGDLGYFLPEMMVTPFSNAVKTLRLSQISSPVKTDFGWHVIQLNDKRAQPKPRLEQVKPQIEARLSQKILSDHIAELKKSSKIKVY